LQRGTTAAVIRWNTSLLESPMRIHLVLLLAARKALTVNKQLSGSHAKHMNV